MSLQFCREKNEDFQTESFHKIAVVLIFAHLSFQLFRLKANYCSTGSDNYGGCGVDSLGRRYVRRNVGIDLGDNSHSLRFQSSPIDSPNGNPAAAGTAYIKVYRSNSTTWDLVPENFGENGIGEVGAYLTSGTRTGSPIVPFWFKVTRQ